MEINKKIYRSVEDITIDEFKKATVLLFVDDNNRPTVLIRNSTSKKLIEKGKTDNLEYHLNSVIEKDGELFYFHVITCLKDDPLSMEQFEIGFKYLFGKIAHPLRDKELAALIDSLESLFKISKEKDVTKLRIGVYGELLFLDYVYDNGYKSIFDKYHSDFFSKHDIELNSKNRIEIKTSVGSTRIHNFRHDQIFRDDVTVYVGSLLLEHSKEGLSLLGLMERILEKTSNPDFVIALGTIKSMCRISVEDPGPSFSFDRAISMIRVYEANSLPHLEIGDSLGITNVSYDVDCSTTEGLPIESFISALNAL